MEIDTHPGFALTHKNHEIEFINAFELGFFSKKLEYETDWRELMDIVGNTFNQHDDLDIIKDSLEEKIAVWPRSWEDNHELQFDIQVSIEERKYFNGNSAGRKKYVSVRFNDSLKTHIVFFVTRLRNYQSLKDLAAERITESLKDNEDSGIEDFEIPKSLKEDLNMAIKSQWTARWHKNWIRKQ